MILLLSFLQIRFWIKFTLAIAMAEASTTTTTFIPTFTLTTKQKPHSILRHLPLPRRKPQFHCSISASDNAIQIATSEKTIPWGCEIESLESASALQRWLSDSGLPPQKMAIERVDVGERGLVALKNVRKGEKLLFVPPCLLLFFGQLLLGHLVFLQVRVTH